MKIVVLGTRGIPDIQGGVETHCQQLYPLLARRGHDITVICRSCYLPKDHPREYRGVRLKSVYAPRRKSIEAIVHTFLGILAARRMHPDVLHIHAIGPSLLTPLARLLGMRVVTTNHGPDYDRQKWGRLAKWVLRSGERMGARFSNRVIVISTTIANILASRYGRRDTDLIYNGVPAPQKAVSTDYITSLGLTPGGYILALGRLVPEKGFDDLITAYTSLSHPGVKLVIAGDADHADLYSRKLKERGASTPGVVMPGFVSGEPLRQLLTYSRLFAMPSYHEGLPIALLEAMSYGLDVAVSDIPACRLPQLTPADHHRVGDPDSLARLLNAKLAQPAAPRIYDLSPYSWPAIAAATEDVYRAAAK